MITRGHFRQQPGADGETTRLNDLPERLLHMLGREGDRIPDERPQDVLHRVRANRADPAGACLAQIRPCDARLNCPRAARSSRVTANNPANPNSRAGFLPLLLPAVPAVFAFVARAQQRAAGCRDSDPTIGISPSWAERFRRSFRLTGWLRWCQDSLWGTPWRTRARAPAPGQTPMCRGARRASLPSCLCQCVCHTTRLPQRKVVREFCSETVAALLALCMLRERHMRAIPVERAAGGSVGSLGCP